MKQNKNVLNSATNYFIRTHTTCAKVNFVTLHLLTSINCIYLVTNCQCSVTIHDKW